MHTTALFQIFTRNVVYFCSTVVLCTIRARFLIPISSFLPLFSPVLPSSQTAHRPPTTPDLIRIRMLCHSAVDSEYVSVNKASQSNDMYSSTPLDAAADEGYKIVTDMKESTNECKKACNFTYKFLNNLPTHRKQFFVNKRGLCVVCKLLVCDHQTTIENYIDTTDDVISGRVLWTPPEILWMKYYVCCCEKLCYYDIEAIQAIWNENGWPQRSKRAILGKEGQLRKSDFQFTSEELAILARGWE